MCTWSLNYSTLARTVKCNFQASGFETCTLVSNMVAPHTCSSVFYPFYSNMP